MMNTHLCRTILATGALLALISGGYAQAEKPNIVLIMCDDIEWRDPSCFGNDRVATPNIDRLAKEGKDREYVRICYGKDLFVMDRRFRLHEDGRFYDIPVTSDKERYSDKKSNNPEHEAPRKRLQVIMDQFKAIEREYEPAAARLSSKKDRMISKHNKAPVETP